MINKVFTYPELSHGISIELEIMSSLNPLALIELSQHTGIPMEYSASNIPPPNRDHWYRFPVANIVITAEEEAEYKKLNSNFPIHCHRIGSPILRTRAELLSIQQLVKIFINSADIVLNKDVLYSFRVYRDFNINTSICYKTLELILFKMYNNINTSVYIHPNNLQINCLNNIDSWFTLRNTIFMVHDIVKSINVLNLDSFNLYSCTENPTLQDFIRTKMVDSLSTIK